MTTNRAPSAPLTIVGLWLRHWAERRAAARRAAQDRALLRAMNGRDLIDIGIGAGEIEAMLLSAPYRTGR